MELKVWVEGIQRIVCGVTVNTTCQDVVFALAHATGKVGRFTLIERWRNNERHLAPNENPLKLLLKWGEYANDVQFILQRSENKQQQQQQLQLGDSNNINNANNQANAAAVLLKKPLGISNNNNNNNNVNNSSGKPDMLKKQQQQQHQQKTQYMSGELSNEKILKKSFGAYDAKHIENIGIVKGIPQQQQRFINSSNKTTPANTIVTTPSILAHTSAQNSPIQTTTTTSTTIQQQQIIPKHEKSHSNPIEMPSTQTSTSAITAASTFQQQLYNNNNHKNSNMYSKLGAQHSKSINEINLVEVRNALDRRTAATPGDSPTTLFYSHNNNNNNNNNNNQCNQNTPTNNNNNNISNENLIDIYAAVNNNNNSTPYNASPDLYKQQQQTPTISANGALVPPPYRDPPPPRNSPLQRSGTAETISNSSSSTLGGISTHQHPNTNPFISDYNGNNNNDCDYELQQFGSHINNNNIDDSDNIFQATQYNDLLQLIKFQREKISTQQQELTKYDAEIVFLEHKERDHAQELEAISREISKADQIFRQGSEQLQTLQYVEEENELVKQQEKTLKSEIALLRSKLANCETELLQCKNKVRILMDDIELEQRAITQKQKSNRQNVERDFLIEMERIQSEIDQALHNTDSSNKTAENLKKELLIIENAIAEKKRQVEQLVNEMKEVNLQSLTVTTSEEIKHLLEGSNKPGSSRRIIGSPRQLENAVPTSKNPHGVWV